MSSNEGISYIPIPRQFTNRRIFGLVFLSFVALIGYFTIWSYNALLVDAEKNTLFRLRGIANSLTVQIDASEHQSLLDQYNTIDNIKKLGENVTYDTIHQILARNYAANRLTSPTYTMVFDTTQSTWVFGVTSSAEPYYRHAYQSSNRILNEKAEVGGTIPMYKDEFGYWLTAFAPLKNKQGATVAVVMVDEHFDDFINNARHSALNNILFALAIILPALLILLIYLRRVFNNQSLLQKNLQESYQKNVNISQQLAESYGQLKYIDQFRKEMIANVSHDLRTPLANLSGYIETIQLKKDSLSRSDFDKYINIVLQESERLKRLIDDLFELSKLESNQIQLHKEPFNIAEMLQDILQKYEVVCQKRNIKIVAQLSEQTPFVVADIKLIDRVLQNLLDNAIRYNDAEKGGLVSIALEKNNDNFLTINILNTGKGIATKDLPHVFDRYFKKDPQGKPNSSAESSGLGLAIVKKIIELHQTTINVKSNANETVFSFDLPIYK